MNGTIVTVFVVIFALITVMGFVAARWRAGDMDLLHEWGLGGRRFGTFVAWFLIGGDLYTAYTFIAVPALMFGAGAIGFFAVPYTIIIYPLLYLVFPRLWSVAKKHGYVTVSEFVGGRYRNRWLTLAIAATGLLATMPYIALQLVGIQVVIGAMGLSGDLPILIAFVILAAFTYTSGLRAPAMIAFVKDGLIYLVVIVAIFAIPAQLGGWGAVFAKIPAAKLLLAAPKGASVGAYGAYATLAFGSAAALFFYPHAITGILSSQSRQVVRRNAALLPAYSLILGLLALFGFLAIAKGVGTLPGDVAGFKTFGPNFAVPALILASFPSWFAGVAFAAIAVGALVPAAVMSIAAANLFTRDIYRPFFAPDCPPAAEAQVAKIVSLVVKLGALAFVLFLPFKYAIQLQFLGGIWISQTVPSILIGLYTRALNGWALLVGWAAGMAVGSWMVAALHFAGTVYPLHLFGVLVPGYAAVWALATNLVVSVVLSVVFNLLASDRDRDETVPAASR